MKGEGGGEENRQNDFGQCWRYERTKDTRMHISMLACGDNRAWCSSLCLMADASRMTHDDEDEGQRLAEHCCINTSHCQRNGRVNVTLAFERWILFSRMESRKSQREIRNSGFIRYARSEILACRPCLKHHEATTLDCLTYVVCIYLEYA